MRRILACVDLSPSSDAVIDCARDLAAPDGTVVVLHVSAPEPDFVGYKVGPSSVRDSVARDLREQHRAVEQLAARVHDAGVTVTPLAVQGVAAERIVEHAARLRADFIVVASSGHGALHDLLFGSTVPGLLHKATAPVVVVPHLAE